MMQMTKMFVAATIFSLTWDEQYVLRIHLPPLFLRFMRGFAVSYSHLISVF